MSGETFTPPSGVQSAAKRALEWIKDGQAGSGFTNVGRRRASDLANAHGISEKTLRRMSTATNQTKRPRGLSPGKTASHHLGVSLGTLGVAMLATHGQRKWSHTSTAKMR